MVEAETSYPDAAFPHEPFACPYCGQMLAASCRVCVACRRPINPTDILVSAIPGPAAEPQGTEGAIAPVRFSWPIFFVVLAFLFMASVIALLVFGGDEKKVQVVLIPIPLVSALWVILDGTRKGLPHPLRWGLGTLLMWLIFFPWYLARRQKPNAPSPFVEGRGMLILLLLLVVVNLLFLLIGGPVK